MAYDYKAIGVSAAKVVSALALAGGLLWYQRTTHPVVIPQPQDEAEIMLAVLERAEAMVEPTQFVVNHPENTSAIVTGTVYNVSVGISARMLVTYPDGTTGAVYGVSDGFGGFYSGAWTWAYGYCYYTPYEECPEAGEACYWFVNSISPYDLVPYDLNNNPVATTHAYATCVSNQPLYKITTNQAAWAETNQVGRAPSIENYPAKIRSSLLGAAYADEEAWFWLVPSNSYFTTGDWNVETIASARDSAIVRYDYSWWTNWITAPTGSYVSSVIVPTTNVVSYHGGLQTNVTYGIIYTTNAVTDGVATMDNKLFAFERDHAQKALNQAPDYYQYPVYWSTNVLNDMARALSAMQWQRTGHYGSVLWTEPGDDFSYPNIVLVEAYKKRDSGVTTETFTVQTNTVAGFQALGYGQFFNADWRHRPTTRFEGYERVTSTVTDLYVVVAASCVQLQITNRTALAWTNGTWWPGAKNAATNALNYCDPLMGRLLTTPNYQKLNTNSWTCAPYARISSQWIPMDIDALSLDTIPRVQDFMAAEWARLGTLPSLGLTYFYPGDAHTDLLPYWVSDINLNGPLATYRVLMQGCTNYLNHVPMR